MSAKRCSSQTITKLIQKQTVLTFPELQDALGPVSRQTVCRKMVEAGCQSSYSHGGRYYTLEESIDYDENGLWSYGDIHFSQDGTLSNTLVRLVEQSNSGLLARELQHVVQLDVLNVLTRLSHSGRVSRIKTGDHYRYFAKNVARQNWQRRNHATPLFQWDDELLAVTKTFCNTLNEKQRRLFAGWVSLLPGSGGDQRVAKTLGMSRTTTTKGRRELLTEDILEDRIRKPGGGRKSVEKKTLDSRPLSSV